MKDRLGKCLMNWRIRKALPYVNGFLLDVGCGTNDLIKKYDGKGIGADVYQWGDVDVLIDDSGSLPFNNNAFNTVTIIAALNHIKNRTMLLSETHRVLKNQGRLILTMIPPRISKIWHFLRRPWDVDQRARGIGEGEVFGLTAKEIRSFLKNAGFEILSENRFMFGINRIFVSQKK